METNMMQAPVDTASQSSTSVSTKPLVVSLVTRESEFSALRDEWNELARRSPGASVFQRHEWVSAWLHAEQGRAQLFILLVRCGGELRGIAPLCIKPSQSDLPGIRVLQFLGTPAADYLDLLLDGEDRQVIVALVDTIMDARHRWDAWWLCHLVAGSTNSGRLLEELARRGIASREVKRQIAPYLELPEDPKRVAESLPKGVRYDLRKGLERLAETGEVNYEVIRTREMALKVLPEFVEVLRQREIDAERPSTREAREWFARYFAALLKGPAFDLVHFSRMSAGKVAVAYHFGFKYKGRLYWYKPTFDPTFAKAQPGKLLIKTIIESAVEEHIFEFDFLLGHEPYKFQWTKSTRSLVDELVFSQTMRSRSARLWLIELKPALKNSKRLRAAVQWLRAKKGSK
jgi:CelD/BcsL family acetyltransferase involved in cellulose biosynthesis